MNAHLVQLIPNNHSLLWNILVHCIIPFNAESKHLKPDSAFQFFFFIQLGMNDQVVLF